MADIVVVQYCNIFQEEILRRHGGVVSTGVFFAEPVRIPPEPSDSDPTLEEIMLRSFENDERAIYGGLSKEVIDRHLKTKDHHPSHVSDDTCVVCQDSLSREDHRLKIATLDCGHDFHASCIKPWLMRNNCCPLCKARGISVH